MAEYINIETLPCNGFMKIIDLDKSLVGTNDYLGFAYFWNYAYRHYLRGEKPHTLRKVHSAFINNKLPLSGESNAHFNIIKKLTKLK